MARVFRNRVWPTECGTRLYPHSRCRHSHFECQIIKPHIQTSADKMIYFVTFGQGKYEDFVFTTFEDAQDFGLRAGRVFMIATFMQRYPQGYESSDDDDDE